MRGDVGMLRTAATVWHARFTEENKQRALLPSGAGGVGGVGEVGGVGGVGGEAELGIPGSGPPGPPHSWLGYLHSLYVGVAADVDVEFASLCYVSFSFLAVCFGCVFVFFVCVCLFVYTWFVQRVALIATNAIDCNEWY